MTSVALTQSRSNLKWLSLSVIVVLLDQISKYFASHYLVLGQPKHILPFFNFTLAFNTGSAFSFLNNQSGWQIWFFAAIACVVSIVLLVWLIRTPQEKIILPCGLAMIIGGAIGNVIDRVHLGYVIDFLDFHLNNWHWATFNIADSAVVVGAFLIIADSLLQKRKSS